jgi:hypothetical protein
MTSDRAVSVAPSHWIREYLRRAALGESGCEWDDTSSITRWSVKLRRAEPGFTTYQVSESTEEVANAGSGVTFGSGGMVGMGREGKMPKKNSLSGTPSASRRVFSLIGELGS